MSLESLKSALPEYAKDIKLNLGSLSTEPSLTTQQRAGTFIAAALASRNATVTAALVAEFTHLVGGDYPTMPAKLRMNVMARPGVDKADFELWSLAVSAVNGCGMCMESHDKVVRAAGLTSEQVQSAVRIAATVHAVAATLDGEAALLGGVGFV
jgi:alkyl hydroperoxide reductase subunit D